MRAKIAARPPSGGARPPCASDYRISGYRLSMQFIGGVIEYFDHGEGL